MTKVIYTIATRIGSSGLGTVSKYAIEALKDGGLLKVAIAYGNLTKLDDVITIPFNPFKPFSLISKKRYYPLKKNFFDFISSQILKSYQFNVLHTWLNQSLFSIKVAKKRGVKVILECGSTHPRFRTKLLNEEYENLGLGKRYASYTNEMERALKEIELADFILTPSQFARDTFLEEDIDEGKVKVIPRGVNISKFYPESKGDDPLTVIFAGHIGVRKGVHYLLEAWKRANLGKKARLILLGDIQDDFKEIIKRYGLGSIIYEGFTKEPWRYFNKGHIFVFPSLEEGSAKVIYEAMASGMAVITTYNSGSVIENNIDGLIIPIRDADAIKSSIELLAENKEFRDYLSQNAIQKVKRFTWENYSENLLGFYRDNIL